MFFLNNYYNNLLTFFRIILNKIGFWPLFAIVISSQVGSGIFMLPASLAPYGILGILGLVIAAVGAISLAIIFAALCSYLPKTGGPHVYVNEAFGKSAAFFTGWTYWVVSWVSSTAVIVAIVGSLTPIVGHYSQESYIAFEMLLLCVITLINIKGVSSSAHFESLVSVLKFTPLILIPLFSLMSFNIDNFMLDTLFSENTVSSTLSNAVVLSLWGFIGLEVATTPADSVSRPERNMPIAIIIGTIFVAGIYLINSVAIMGIIPGNELQHSSAAYVDVTQYIFGGNWHLIVSFVASVVCISTLNAWVLASGQVALGLSESGFMPKIFSKTNSNGAPIYGLLASGLGIIPLLLLTNAPTLAQQITDVIDFSVIAFLFVYLICVCSFLSLQIKKKVCYSFKNCVAVFAALFCMWVIIHTPLKVILISSSFILSGIPLYVYNIVSSKK